MPDDKIIAVDPGRQKCGVAAVSRTKGVLFKTVIETPALASTVKNLADRFGAALIVVGDHTSSKDAQALLKKLIIGGREATVILVDERHSTDEARIRYWQENPPRGLRRLIPVTMQVPPVPVDDYVAVILAERYFGTPAK